MLVILSGVSGSGKDTIKRELIKRIENVDSLPSYTSRKKRIDEIEGENYYFISKEEFQEKIANDEFYEYDIHHKNYYGTSRKLLNEKIDSGKIIVKDIDVNGTENLVKLLGNDMKIVTIFLKVSRDELRNRLLNRNDKLDLKEIELRLDRMEYEESKLGLYDYVIRNEELEKTVQIISTILSVEL